MMPTRHGTHLTSGGMEALQIRFEQVSLLYRPTISVAIGYGLAASLVALVQWTVIDHTVILTWLACMGLVIAGRVLSFISFQRNEPDLHDIKRWEQLFLTGSIAAGLVWGSAGIWLFPHGYFEYQILTLLALVGLSAGGVTTLSALRLPIFIFLALLMTPVTIHFFVEYNDISTAVGGMMIVYTAFLASSAYQSYKNHLENITLRIESINRESHIRETEKRLLQTQRIAHLGGWEWNFENKDLYWSDETYRIFGLQPGDIEPSYEAYIALIHPDDRKKVQHAVKKAVEECTAFHASHRIVLAGQVERFVNQEGEIHVSDTGQAMRMTGTIHDITEHTKLEEQLLQSQKMEAVGTLVGGIAHDFNNILAGMAGNLYLAKKNAQEPDVQKKLARIEQLSLRAADLIKQLMTFARKDRVMMKSLALAPFFKEVLKLLRSSIPENIEIYPSLCSESLQIDGDETQLHQLLMNLVNNARDAVEDEDEPYIKIKLEACNADDAFIHSHRYFKAGAYAHLSVEDNGSGIPENQIEHLFEPFFTTKEQGKGTGLGLSMVFGAVKTHHGYIEVESIEGKGSTFHIYLPLLKNQMLTPEPLHEEEVIEGLGELILLVDDEPNIREMGSEVLSSLGYKVLQASNGIEAVDLFTANKDEVALIVMDIVMPLLGGVKAAELIKNICPDVKLIFSTGYDRGVAFPDISPLTEAVILTKPYNINVLNKMIRQELDA